MIQRTVKVIGIKQTCKAIEQDFAALVIIAKDANPMLTGPVAEKCRKKGVPVEYCDTSRKLGFQHGIKVCASVVCILKENI